MNDNDAVVKCPKNPTTEPRCHSDQVDPLVLKNVSELLNNLLIQYSRALCSLPHDY